VRVRARTAELAEATKRLDTPARVRFSRASSSAWAAKQPFFASSTGDNRILYLSPLSPNVLGLKRRNCWGVNTESNTRIPTTLPYVEKVGQELMLNPGQPVPVFVADVVHKARPVDFW